MTDTAALIHPKFHHVNLKTTRLQEMIDFYRTLVGAEVIHQFEGGAWLTLFAPRNRLIEFVLEEESYRADMMREVPRDCWIAPSLSSGASLLRSSGFVQI